MNSDQIKKISDFYDLLAWKESVELVKQVYKICLIFPDTEKFGIVDQLKRAVTSISANIAEGFGRFHYTDRIHFYYQARGSLKEVQNFLLISREIRYLDNGTIKSIWPQTKLCEKLLNGLIKSSQNLKTS